MGEDRSQTSRQRVTVAEASEILGVTVEAVRGRIKRGKLEHERDSGTVYVLLDADQSNDQPSTGQQPADDQSRPDARGELEDELRDRIRFLERMLEQEQEARTEERRRHDTIIAQLSAANAEQARTIRAIEAPAAEEEPPEAAEAVEEPEASEPRSGTLGAQEGARRPWWRRVFGG